MREGSLEAPTRHSIDWRSPGFYDQGALHQEMERIFDICHGCRRCVNLCNAFPTLFDLVDASVSGEVDSVAKEQYGKVVDQCYLCDLCYMTKCPYVPPHPWNVDFPHLMLRAKALQFKSGQTHLRDRLLTSTDKVGKLATIPIVVQAVNKANRTSTVRRWMARLLGIHSERVLPPYAQRRFAGNARKSIAFPVRDGKLTPGKVTIFTTCYGNYNEPHLVHDLIRILDHNEIPYVLVDQEKCCGMPKLELGDLDTVDRLRRYNAPRLAKWANAGYAILTPIPSCTLMFKNELPLLFPEDVAIKEIAAAMFDPFEYLIGRDRDGLLKRDFKKSLGRVAYHIPCHSRVQNIGQKTREILQLVPGTEVTTVERCSGHDGTWGVKQEYFEMSMKIGRPVFRQIADTGAHYVSSDCPIAARHIIQGIERHSDATTATQAHPLTLLRVAYGLEAS